MGKLTNLGDDGRAVALQLETIASRSACQSDGPQNRPIEHTGPPNGVHSAAEQSAYKRNFSV